MQRKQVDAHPSGIADATPLLRGMRVCDKSNEHASGGERGIIIRLGTEANGWTGYAWVKFDRFPGRWVNLTHLEVLEMPAADEHQKT